MTHDLPEDDPTVALIRLLKQRAKGRVKLLREVEGVGILNVSVQVQVAMGPLDLDLEARGLSLHEAAQQMLVLVDAIAEA